MYPQQFKARSVQILTQIRVILMQTTYFWVVGYDAPERVVNFFFFTLVLIACC